jgi:GntR family transcriptional regulator / MocR family aminotransferase
MTTAFQLALALPPAGSRRLRRDLHAQLKAAILDGRLAAGLRLPATRALADALDISRNSVTAAYDLLLSEGYIVTRPGAGAFVADPLPRRHRPPPDDRLRRRALAAPWRDAAATLRHPPGECDCDMRLGAPDRASFPFDAWRQVSNRALRTLARAPEADPHPAGRAPLREAIAQHVSFARAVACRSEDVVVTAGAQQAMDLLARVLVTPGRTVVAVEDPGYPPVRAAFARAGARLVGVRVDDEGLVADALPAYAHVVCVTPSHQFPLGVAMSPARRAALLAFARERDAVVIEDDYDGEFRFDARPMDALQTLDADGRVFYVGTFSKVLSPALRLGFVVAPSWAREALAAARQLSDSFAPTLAQDTLAAFIAEGHLARHVRRMQKLYAVRRAALLSALRAHCSGFLAPVPAAAGLHLSARLVAPLDPANLVAQAARAEILLEDLGRYAFGPDPAPGLAFGYGTAGAEEITAAVARLADLATAGRRRG